MQEISSEVTTVERRMIQKAILEQRPINGSLELLPLCNMNCDMCYVRLSRTEMEKQGKMHTAKEWIDIGRQMQKAGTLFLLLTGGEPLLFPDFRKLYLELKKMGMILTINTNGTLINEEWADFFSRYKPRRINITLYGADEATYASLCHYPEGFQKAVAAIRLLRERGVDVKLNGSVTRENRKDMRKIYTIAKEFQVPIHMDAYMYPGLEDRKLPMEQQSRLLPEEAALAELEIQKAELSPEIFQLYLKQKLDEVDAGILPYRDSITCLAGKCSFSVNWKGEIHPCVMLDAPAISVFEEGFETAWQLVFKGSKEYKLAHACTVCRFRPICKICAASAKLETGSYAGVPEYLCRYAKELDRLLRENILRMKKS